MGSPSRLRSSRTRYTCCHPDHAGEPDPGHTRTHVRNLKNRTIHSASRHHDARESGLSHTRIRARNSSNRNVCILSPSQFSFRRVVYQTDSPRAIPRQFTCLPHIDHKWAICATTTSGSCQYPLPILNWILTTLELASLAWALSRVRRRIINHIISSGQATPGNV